MAPRRAVAALWLLTAVLLQLTLLSRLSLPLGPADLTLVSVLCLALLEGPAAGMGYGFGAGLVGDLLSTHTLGQLALVWTLAGYVAGVLAGADGREDRNPLVPMAVVGAGGLLAAGSYAALGVLIGAPHAPTGQLLRVVLASGLYGVLLTPFVYPVLRGLLSRLDPSRV
ncbi:MAG TPA: rod shape-determining protein MreD [Mycobacteriales bacterium]|nr:rod shape-determining protein MreD [Mycobacteriales bacterium]